MRIPPGAQYSPVVQWLEQSPLKRCVVGSNPTGGATLKNNIMENKETFYNRIKPFLAGSDLQEIKLAYYLAKYGHRAQVRKEMVDGKPQRYFEHPRRVAIIVMDELKMIRKDMIIPALLHDSLEDTEDLTPELLEHCFGADITSIVKILSKVPKEGYLTRLSICDDWRVITLKACDKLDNLRSLMVPGTSIEFQKKQIEETKEHYYEIFERLNTLTPNVYAYYTRELVYSIRSVVSRCETLIEIAENKNG